MKAVRVQTSWGDECPPFHRLIDQRDENMSPELREQLIEDLWRRAEIDACALNEAVWDLVMDWDRAISALKKIKDVGSPDFVWTLKRLRDIDRSIDLLEITTPLPKKERRKAFKKIGKRLEGGAA